MPTVIFITHEGHPREVEVNPDSTLGEFLAKLAPEASEIMLNGWEKVSPDDTGSMSVPMALLSRVEVMK